MTKTLPLTEKEKLIASLAKLEADERESHEAQRSLNAFLLGVETATQRLAVGKSKLAAYRALIEGQLSAELDVVIRMPIENFLQSNPGESIRLYHQDERAAQNYNLLKVNELRFADGEQRYIVPLENALKDAKSAFEKFREENPDVIPGVEPAELKPLVK